MLWMLIWFLILHANVLVLLLFQVLFGCTWDVALLHLSPTMATWAGSSAAVAGVFGTTLSSASANDS